MKQESMDLERDAAVSQEKAGITGEFHGNRVLHVFKQELDPSGVEALPLTTHADDPKEDQEDGEDPTLQSLFPHQAPNFQCQ